MAFKKISAVLTAFVLAILMAFQLPVQVFADSKPDYISEIKISIASGKKDSQKSAAQKELTDAGYTLLTHSSNYSKDGKTVFKKGDAVDMNYGTDTALTSEPPAVYLGYKTTKDKDDAITDISMMEMAKESDKNQPYSFAAYDEMLKEYKKQINESISDIGDTLTEFSANYKKGSPAAKWAYTQLNRYKDTDLEKNNKIGDILLAIADDGITDDEKEQLQNYFLKSNINFVNAMNIALGVGCAEYKSDSTWIERFSEFSSDDEFRNSYDSTIEAIENNWETFYDMLYAFKKTGLGTDNVDEDLENYFNKNTNLSDTEKTNILFGAKATVYLSEYEYEGESMLDFFLQDRDTDNIDKEAFIPFVNSFTKGQRATVKSIGIIGLFSGLDNTEKNWNEAADNVETALKDENMEDDVIGIYEGVNTAMYDSTGVALTSEAMTKQASQQDGGWFSYGGNEKFLYLGSLIIFTGVAWGSIMLFDAFVTGHTVHVAETFLIEGYSYVEYGFDAFTGTMFGVSIGLILIGAGCIVGSWIYNYYHQDYTEIPSVMVDAVSKTSKQGITSTYYTYYDSVKCDYDNQTNIPADTNAWTGKRWNAMYTTKDETAGDPILASDFSAQYGSNEKKGCTGVARFHEESAYNMNAHHYGDDVKGIYLFYTSDDGSASYEGTVISSADLGLGIGGGAIGGFAAAASTMYFKFRNKFKKKTKENESDIETAN